MDTDKVLFPFVSDDVVNECFKNLEEVWSCTEYEQLLTEAKVKADKKAESEGTKNMRLRLEAVVKCLNQLEEAAGENKDWWEQWRKDEDKDDPLIIDPYSNIDIEWYQRSITAFKLNAAVKFSIYLLKDAERPWNEADRDVFVSSYLIQLCYTVCECLGIDRVLSPGGDLRVWVHVKALCLYIALHNELNKLKEEAERYGIHFKQETKPKKEKQPAPSVEDLELMTWRDKMNAWKDDVFTQDATRIFGIAAGDGKYMRATGLGYEWIYKPKRKDEPNPLHLVYFLLVVYDDMKLMPWKKLQILFWPKFDKPGKDGVTETGRCLNSNVQSLRKSQWYKRSKTRRPTYNVTRKYEGQYPEWAKDIDDYLLAIKDRIAKEKQAAEEEKKKRD